MTFLGAGHHTTHQRGFKLVLFSPCRGGGWPSSPHDDTRVVAPLRDICSNLVHFRVLSVPRGVLVGGALCSRRLCYLLLVVAEIGSNILEPGLLLVLSSPHADWLAGVSYLVACTILPCGVWLVLHSVLRYCLLSDSSPRGDWLIGHSGLLCAALCAIFSSWSSAGRASIIYAANLDYSLCYPLLAEIGWQGSPT
jgi:hypothetical protein